MTLLEQVRNTKSNKGITAFTDKEAYQRELGLEQERIRRKKTLESLKESEEREAMERAGQGNLFTTEKGGGLS
jgi:hypothetical protein